MREIYMDMYLAVFAAFYLNYQFFGQQILIFIVPS